MTNTANTYQVTYRLRSAAVSLHGDTRGQCKTWKVTVFATDWMDAAAKVQAARGSDGKPLRAVWVDLIQGDAAAWDYQIRRDRSRGQFTPWALNW